MLNSFNDRIRLSHDRHDGHDMFEFVKIRKSFLCIFGFMVVTKLTRELLPHFIFLIDEIHASQSDFVEIGKLARECRDKEIDTSWHSLNRAFAFRNLFKESISPEQTFNIPKKKTLDALTKYLYGEDFIFRDLVLNNNQIDVDNKIIQKHYLANLPNPDTLKKVFEKRPPKVEHLDNQIDAHNHFIQELKIHSLKEFIADEVNKRFEELQKEMTTELELKKDLLSQLEDKIIELEKKRRRAHFVYRFFGMFGLFFVTIDYDEITKTEILEGFMDEYQGILKEDFLDEIL